jgi:ubiquinone/menaquinone biosynthesis C-methylase UbiE
MSLTQRTRALVIADCYRLSVTAGKKALDIGCGNGIVSAALKNSLGVDLHGTDIVDYCRGKIPFRLMDNPRKIPFPDNFFDYVFFNDILHHAQYPEELLLEAARVAPCIMVFEDSETPGLKALDRLFNLFYCAKIPSAGFRDEKGWGQLFSRLGLQYEKMALAYPFYYPLRHICFKLSRKVNEKSA